MKHTKIKSLKLFFSILLFLTFSSILNAQDFLMQGWYWDYPKVGCNGFSGSNWATVLYDKVGELKTAGFTYLWLPPLSRASFGKCSNGYDPKDLYDLGEYGLGRTGFGTRDELDLLISSLNTNGIKAVADVVYNHRDGGAPENNPAVEGWIENYNSTKHSAGDNAYPSDRFRCVLPLGGSTGHGAGNYYFKVKSASEHSDYFGKKYKVYMWTDVVGWQNQPDDEDEGEPNGGGGCVQGNKIITLGKKYWAYIDATGCKVDEFALTLSSSDFNSAGDNIYIELANHGGYSDHYIYELWYNSSNIQAALLYQTYTNFNGLPSGLGGMNYSNFKPNGNPTQLSGDWDWLWFFYDYDQNVTDTRDELFEWSDWLWDNVGIRGLRMDAVKHFSPSFIGDLFDYMYAKTTSLTKDLFVGEYYDSDPTKLNDWIIAVYAAMDNNTKSNILPRVFDFSLRDALKKASDEFGYDATKIFTSSIVDAKGTNPYNVVTFAGNHDFRDAGQYIQNDPILAYAYILTNNQIGLPCVFYPDYYTVTGYPSATNPIPGAKSQIDVLINVHKQFIAGSTARDYLSLGNSWNPSFNSGYATTTLVYQLRNTPSGKDVIVAINYAGEPLNMGIDINMTGVTSTTFGDQIGNATAPILTVSSGRVNIQLPARSYAVWVENQAPVPVELVSFTGKVEKNNVLLNWKTATEVNNYGFEIQKKSLTQTLSEGEGFLNYEMIGFVNGSGNSNSPKEYTFKDNNLLSGNYAYRLKQIDNDGQFEYSNSVFVEVKDNLEEFALYQNYPNPFNPSTKIKYTIPTSNSPLLGGARGGFVTLIVYDVLGNEIAKLVNEEQPAGSYEVEFNASSVIGSTTGRLVSGIYFYQLKAGGFNVSKKMLLLE